MLDEWEDAADPETCADGGRVVLRQEIPMTFLHCRNEICCRYFFLFVLSISPFSLSLFPLA